MSIRPALRTFALASAATVALASLTACGSDEEEKAGVHGSAISAERCAENEAAGTITYMSGYYWQASASILEVIAADKLGYFNDLCLDVEMQPGPGDTSQNAKLLASGKVQITPLSGQDVITSNLNGLDIVGISSYSNAGLDVLMTDDSVADLTELAGKNLGHKGWLPMSTTAMLVKAGLDVDDVKQVKVGYDPSVLTRGQVDALTAFISNEPNQLARAGEEVKVWEPKDFGVPASLGAIAANPAFAEEHPTAVQDFLRATFKAFQYCADDAHVEECLDYQKEVAGAQADTTHETGVWTTEVGVVEENPLPGKFGSIDMENVASLADAVKTFMGMDIDAQTAQGWFDGSFADAVVADDDSVIWPAP